MLMKMDVSIGVVVSGGRVLIGQRPAGVRLAGCWEFPGGKIRPNEPPEQALHRELLEELGTPVQILRPLPLITHQDPDLAVRIHPFLCRLAHPQQPLLPLAHCELRWVTPAQLAGFSFPDANAPLLTLLRATDLAAS